MHAPIAVIVGVDGESEPVLLKAEAGRTSVKEVYMQCESVVPFSTLDIYCLLYTSPSPRD